MSQSRTTKIQSVFKLLQKRYKHVVETPTRTVLEHLIYAACLENATYEQADAAFSVLEHHYIDWNEIRVSTAGELAYTFPHLPEPLAAGERIRKALQAVFEATYMFDLEELRKKSLSQGTEFLHNLHGCSPFMIDYTVQHALGGHVIPNDESSLRVFRLLGLTQVNADRTKEEVNGLERAIPKNQGVLFATLLHTWTSEHFADPQLSDVRPLLKAIDPQALQRDCTAPVLQVIKPVRPERQKPPVSPISVVVAKDLEEDMEMIDEPADVEEVEFIPNPITGEDTPFGYDEDDEDFGGTSAKKPKSDAKKTKEKSKEKKKEKESAPKEKAIPKKLAEKSVEKSAEKSAEKSVEKKSTGKPEKTVKPPAKTEHPQKAVKSEKGEKIAGNDSEKQSRSQTGKTEENKSVKSNEGKTASKKPASHIPASRTEQSSGSDKGKSKSPQKPAGKPQPSPTSPKTVSQTPALNKGNKSVPKAMKPTKKTKPPTAEKAASGKKEKTPVPEKPRQSATHLLRKQKPK